MLKQPLPALALLSFLVGCTPLPLGSIGLQPAPRPVEPLIYEKQGYKVVLASPSVAPGTTTAPTQRPVNRKPGEKLSNEEVATILAQAEDKATSAENLARSAQSKDDWSLVISQWKRAIDILKPAAQLSRVRQQLSEYERNLSTAKVQSKTNPRQIAPGEQSTSNGIPLIVTSESQPSPTPSPAASPTPSPTASPTASPSASPSASPTPSP